MPIYLQYYFWLITVSLFCFALERCLPWRRDQKLLRGGIWQDLFWLAFNGHYLGLLLAAVTEPVAGSLSRLFAAAGLAAPEQWRLLSGMPIWMQFLTVLIVKDLLEYGIHRLMHTIPALWELHKLHHSIETLDWIGNFRFHWGEVLVYKALSYIPLVILGVEPIVLLAIAVLWTVMLSVNHANVGLSYGPLRFVLNSPKMHVWHHDVQTHRHKGQNFGQVLSVWDWLFHTAHWPADPEMPVKLGFQGQASYPRGLVARLCYPLFKRPAG